MTVAKHFRCTTAFMALFLLLFMPCTAQGQAGARDGSAALEVRATTQGFLPPRMPSQQIAEIQSPTEGLLVYDSSRHQLLSYHVNNQNSGQWVVIGAEAPVPLGIPFEAKLAYNAAFGAATTPAELRVTFTNSGTTAITLDMSQARLTATGGTNNTLAFTTPTTTVTIPSGQSQTVTYAVQGSVSGPADLHTRFELLQYITGTLNKVP